MVVSVQEFWTEPLAGLIVAPSVSVNVGASFEMSASGTTFTVTRLLVIVGSENDDLRRKRTGYDVAFRVESLVLNA